MRSRKTALLAPLIIITMALISLPGCCCPFYNQYRDLKKLVPMGTVTGTVYAGNPKQPVPNATVIIADQQTTTDSQGKFKLTVVATTQTITVTSGNDLKWTGTVTVVKDGDVNLPEIILQNVTSSGGTTETYPAAPEDVIRAYYKAVNGKDYNQAATYLSGQMPVDPVKIEASYAPYIKSVEIASIARKANMDYNGRTIYDVTFTAEYIKHYEAGSTNLPTVHAMQQVDGKWKIVDIGTG